MSNNSNYISSVDGIEIPVINLVLTSVNVVVETKKLKTRWTPEIIQDIEYMVGFDDEDSSIYREMMEKEIVKRRRMKDRRKYIKLIEDWTGEKINK